MRSPTDIRGTRGITVIYSSLLQAACGAVSLVAQNRYCGIHYGVGPVAFFLHQGLQKELSRADSANPILFLGWGNSSHLLEASF